MSTEAHSPRLIRDEAGFSLVELLTVTLLMGMVLLMIYGALDAFVFQTRVTELQSRTVQQGREALDQIARDLRAANPIDAVTVATPGDFRVYDNKVTFDVYCNEPGQRGCTTSRLRPVAYRVENHKLIRSVAGADVALIEPRGPAGKAIEEQAGSVLTTNQPVFKYYTKSGVQLWTDPTTTAPAGAVAPQSTAAFRDCARSVEIFLKVRAADTGDRYINLSTRIDLRNWNEVQGCP